jgi:hypothetical protein
MLNAAIVAVQSKVNDRSVLTIRIAKALRKDVSRIDLSPQGIRRIARSFMELYDHFTSRFQPVVGNR